MIAYATEEMDGSDLIPVISRVDSHKLEGVISRDAVLGKYKMIGTEEEQPT